MSKDKNSKLVICIGIPASGKSTWSIEKIKKDSSYARVCRDDFRFMLKDSPICEPKIENLISDLVDESILTLLNKNLNVIVDATNVKASYINHFIKLVETVADVEFMVFDISMKKAMERMEGRDRKVDIKVVQAMFDNYKILMDSFDFTTRRKKARIFPDYTKNWDPKLPNAVVFDVDGTCAHIQGKRSPFDWKNVHRDDIDKIVTRQIKLHRDAGDKILIVSGRDGSCRQETIDWFNLHGLEFDELFMRPANDFRKDSIIKEEI